MKQIILFSEEEIEIINKLRETLKLQGRIDELEQIENNLTSLQQLASSISLYPSILEDQYLGSVKRSAETLVYSLCREEQLDLRFHMPTKALLGNAFLIAKINFFFMLFYVLMEIPELKLLYGKLKDIINKIVFTLMAEEVFLSIIEDKNLDKEIKIKAGYLLANIWEYRLDHGVKEFAPILITIWRARGALTPIFGTMLGFSELFKLTEYIEPSFFEFLQRDELSDEEVESIEEFIFGLCYEETVKIRDEMSRLNKYVISKKDVERIIGDNRIYPEYDISDPRELYRSFSDRKSNAKFRAKSSLSGPHKTIEEYLMCYLLQKMDLISTGINYR
ncbi:MAG: hypothetical protein JW864_04570 [Spirochaetes bacterium]|nr:hypothetical protein [Spirochaetota bacterium]